MLTLAFVICVYTITESVASLVCFAVWEFHEDRSITSRVQVVVDCAAATISVFAGVKLWTLIWCL